MKSSFNRLLPLCLLGTCLLLGCTDTSIQDPIQLDSGLVSGTVASDPSIKVYKGIPFAAPPVGDLRWRPPQPVEPWEGVLAADSFPDACVQNAAGERLPWTKEFMHQGEISEDCLYLNVWTGATSTTEKRPVMVYIYGGGFGEGSNAIDVYDGEELAKKGVVLVSVNYRVGPLGFMTHPELTAESEHSSSGNYGLLDQTAGLEWVQKNIAAFGGDPEQVTIFGQSAGAMSVAFQVQSPLAAGLFDRAIILSGPGLFSSNALGSNTPLATAEEAGLRYAEATGAASLADLRALPAETFLQPGLGRFGPVTDGWFLPENRQMGNVPLINGFTADDLGMSGGFGPPSEATVAAYEAEAHERFGDQADTFLSLYPAESDEDVPGLRKASARDQSRVSVSLWAAELAKPDRPVYTYYFNRAIPWPDQPQFGAFHTGEIPYVFNNLKMLDRPWEAVDHTVADQISSYWVNFASTGNPNGEGLPTWPSYNEDPSTTMALGAETGPIPLASPEKVSFWTTILTGSE